MTEQLKLPKPVRASAPIFRLAVYGEGGTGKTQLALSFPKPLVIDTDGGLEGGAIEAAGGKIVDAESWAPEVYRDLRKLYAWLKLEVDKRGYKTIVIDSIDTLCRMLLAEATDLPNQGREAKAADNGELVTPQQPDYGKVADAVYRFLTDLKTLSKERGIHIVITSAVREPDPERKRYKRTFDVQPAVEAPLLYWANVYGELVVNELPLEQGVRRNSSTIVPEERILWTNVGDRARKNKTRFASLRPGVKEPTFAKLAGLIDGSWATKGSK